MKGSSKLNDASFPETLSAVTRCSVKATFRLEKLLELLSRAFLFLCRSFPPRHKIRSRELWQTSLAAFASFALYVDAASAPINRTIRVKLDHAFNRTSDPAVVTDDVADDMEAGVRDQEPLGVRRKPEDIAKYCGEYDEPRLLRLSY
ncbi:hypothetical protein FVE85_4057 [Porphyridium purpureum]|uniref:Uncharacterized protein n=1 Tax=Porphyridium purpureum TaxID=35688 RepID=A0A5J4YTC0_PORPP|nr:hypothetical protein FVE85_4057 [Porphyridium purpureum]|eukprot:POR4074..scf229_5